MNRMEQPPVAQSDVSVVALRKGDEGYVFLWDDANRDAVLRQIGRWAATPDLSFSWNDAALCAQKVRQVVTG